LPEGCKAFNGDFSGQLRNETGKMMEVHEGKFIVYDLTSDVVDGRFYYTGELSNLIYAT